MNRIVVNTRVASDGNVYLNLPVGPDALTSATAVNSPASCGKRPRPGDTMHDKGGQKDFLLILPVARPPTHTEW
jgi:hypothetical protein